METAVEGVEVVDHPFDGELIADEVAPLTAEGGAVFGVGGEAADGGVKEVKSPGWNQVPGLVGETDFGGAIAVVGDHGSAGGEGLGEGTGEALAAGQVDQDVHDSEEGGDVGRWHEAGEDEVPGETEPVDGGLEAGAVGAVADEEESEVGEFADEVRGGGDEVVVTLEGEEAGDGADDEVILGEAEAGAENGVGSGVEVGIEVEAADDAGVLGWETDAGGEVLTGHGLGDGDEVGGEVAGEAFGGAEEEIGGASLERAEGGTVNGVNDDGGAGETGGEAAEEAGLAAVGVDDVGAGGAQVAGEGDEGEGVEGGVNGADEGGKEGEEVRDGAGGGFEGAFGTAGGTGEEADIQAMAGSEAEDGGEGVFLGTADDEAGDEVKDAHGYGDRATSGAGWGAGRTVSRWGGGWRRYR